MVSVYGPTKDEQQFPERLQEQLTERQNPNIVIAGDWNWVLKPSLDYCNYKHGNNPEVQEKVSEMTTELGLTDVRREINPEV